MRRLWMICLTSSLVSALAQNPPTPELGLDINAQGAAVVAQGWPMLIRTAIISADGQLVTIGLKNGPWTQALGLTIADQNGKPQTWPVQLVPTSSTSLSLSGITNNEAVWLVAPGDTLAIPIGTYSASVTLDTTFGATDGSWIGTLRSKGASVQLQVEPASLTSEQEAAKYLAIAAYSELRGDKQGAGAALDTLISHQPDSLQAYYEKGDLQSADGDYKNALSSYQEGLNKFLARNPHPPEPITLLVQPILDATAQLAAQQLPANSVTSVSPGNTLPVIAADSIVNAYGAGLAKTPTNSSGPLSTTLGGTSVSIKDSTGKTAAAQLFFAGPGQVNFAAPAGLALGAATVTLKPSDGTTHTGSVKIVDVQPGLFTSNAAGLIAGNIIRTTSSGHQTTENLYTLDGSGNVVAAPVNISQDQVFLAFYCTGIRHASASKVSVIIGDVKLPVTFAGAQGSFVGLDQVNVQLPATLAGSGDVPLVLMVEGHQSNTARITIQ